MIQFKFFFSILAILSSIGATAQWARMGSSIERSTNNRSFYGSSLSMSGDGNTIIAGSSAAALPMGIDCYSFDGNDWTLKGSNFPTTLGFRFGASLSLSRDGNILAISDHAANSYRGRTYLYEYNSGQWSPKGDTLEGPFSNFLLGRSTLVSSNGERLIVRGDYNDGVVYLYEFTANSWSRIGDSLSTSERSAEYGRELASSSSMDTIAVGAPGVSFDNGAVEVYALENGNLVQIGNTIQGSNQEILGSSVALNSLGNLMVIGSSGYDQDTLFNLGRVITYEFLNGDYVATRDTLVGDSSMGYFGSSIALSSYGNIMAVGQSGTALKGYVHIYEGPGIGWRHIQRLEGDQVGENFGSSIAINDAGTRIIVGSPGYDSGTREQSGRIQVFQKSVAGRWEKVGDSSELDVYPNPVVKELHFDVDLNGRYFEINGIDGSLISKGKITGHSIDTRKLESGLYILNVEGVGPKKFLKN